MRTKQLKQEYEKLKSLKGCKKVEYLWCYYKFILVVFAIVAMVFYTGITMYANSRINSILSLVIVDLRKDRVEAVETMRNELLAQLGGGAEDEIIIEMNATSLADDNASMKLAVVFSPLSENDIVICNQEVYKRFAAQMTFIDWQDILGTAYETYEVYMTGGALDLAKSEKWRQQGITEYAPAYAVVLEADVNTEALKALLSYYFDET